MTASTLKKYTLEEYFEFEMRASNRNEYHDGTIIPMAYTSENHSLIVINVAGELRTLLKNSNCRAYSSDRMLYVAACNKTYYPDVMIVCGKSELYSYSKNMQATLNPVVLIEVLSESTKQQDRIKKWQCYRQISSLQQYILITQDSPAVEVYNRVEHTDHWQIQTHLGLESAISVAGVALPVQEIYLNVEVQEEETE